MVGEGVLSDPEPSWPPGVVGKEVAGKSRWVFRMLVTQAGTWDLGPFAAMLVPGQSLFEQQNTKKL